MAKRLTLKTGMSVRVEWWDAGIHVPVIGTLDDPLMHCVSYGMILEVDDHCIQLAMSAYAPPINRYEDILTIPLGPSVVSITKMERGAECAVPKGKRRE